VLVGDAFSTSCPPPGPADKMFTDVGRLCNVYIPQWHTEGMNAQKIAQFYDDPETGCEDRSRTKAYHLRSLSTDNGLTWRAQRWVRILADCSRDAANGRQGIFGGIDGAPRCAERATAARPAGLRPASESSKRRRAHSPVVLIIIIVFILVLVVIIGESAACAAYGPGHPELAVDAVGGEQLRMRAALDALPPEIR